MNTLSVINLFPSDEEEYHRFTTLLKKEIRVLPERKKNQTLEQLKYVEKVVAEIKESFGK